LQDLEYNELFGSAPQKGVANMNLWEYVGKKVKITSISGCSYTGLADIYSYDDSNEDGFASLDVDMGDGTLMAFAENEIAHIEIIPGKAVSSLRKDTAQEALVTH
jgi:hypothetical protein